MPAAVGAVAPPAAPATLRMVRRAMSSFGLPALRSAADLPSIAQSALAKCEQLAAAAARREAPLRNLDALSSTLCDVIDVSECATRPSVNVVPEAQSTPNMATMSPAVPLSTSSMSAECMRTSFGTRTFDRSAIEWIVSPRLIVPW